MWASSSASSGAANDCERHGLTLGGHGTHADPCKYAGETLAARFTGRILDDQPHGAVIAFTNPWPEPVVLLTAALFYYDKDGKQLSVTVEGNAHKAIVATDIKVDLPGKTTTHRALGVGPADVPLGADTVEVRVLSFALGYGGEYRSADRYQEDRARNGGPSAGTGIAACDDSIALAMKCAQTSGTSASRQRLVSVHKWLYGSSADMKDLAKQCAADTVLVEACR